MIFSWFKALSSFAIQCPNRTLAIATLVSFGVSSGIFRLELRTDGRALASPTAPKVVADGEIRTHFGIRDQLVVFIKAANTNGVFNPATMQLMRDLTSEFKKIPGVVPADVLSLATELNFRLRLGTVRHALLQIWQTLPLIRSPVTQIDSSEG